MRQTRQNFQFIPGYQSEVISQTQVLASVVPEDPLYCRFEEMTFKYLNLSPEMLVGALDEEMNKLQVEKIANVPKIDTTELTAADKCF